MGCPRGDITGIFYAGIVEHLVEGGSAEAFFRAVGHEEDRDVLVELGGICEDSVVESLDVLSREYEDSSAEGADSAEEVRMGKTYLEGLVAAP